MQRRRSFERANAGESSHSGRAGWSQGDRSEVKGAVEGSRWTLQIGKDAVVQRVVLRLGASLRGFLQGQFYSLATEAAVLSRKFPQCLDYLIMTFLYRRFQCFIINVSGPFFEQHSHYLIMTFS